MLYTGKESKFYMSVNKVNLINSPSFGSSRGKIAADALAESDKMVSAMKKQMPKAVRVMNKLGSFDGEVPNIIINALGTGLVAPFFIKYNFLSKTDEDTRTYTAFRQPVSAVLAVITQAGLVIPFDRLIAKMTNEGEFLGHKFDQAGHQDTNYLKRMIKKANPTLDKDTISKMAKDAQREQFAKMVDGVLEHNTIHYLDKNGKAVKLPQKDFKKLLESTTKSMMDGLSSDIKKYDGEMPQSLIKRNDFIRTNEVKLRDTLKEILDKVGPEANPKEVSKEFKSKIKQLKTESAPKELIEIVDELSRHKDAKTVIDKVKEFSSSCDEFGKCETYEQVKSKVMSGIEASKKEAYEQQKVIKELQKKISADVPMKDVLEHSEKLKTNFVSEVVQKHVGNIEKRIKGFKQLTGLIVSLAILPVTCSLLNHVYPKIMDALFPELSKHKKSKGNDKFVKSDDVKTSSDKEVK